MPYKHDILLVSLRGISRALGIARGLQPTNIKDLEPEGEKNQAHTCTAPLLPLFLEVPGKLSLQLSVNSSLARRFLGFISKEQENG